MNVNQMREGVDQVVLDMIHDQREAERNGGQCSVWLTMPSGNAVRLEATRGIIRCLLMTPKPPSSSKYLIARFCCWFMFATHAVTLGSTSLMYQILSVLIIIASTLLLLTKRYWGRKSRSSMMVGNELEFVIDDKKAQNDFDKGKGTHMHAYANIGMTTEQEESMRSWGLMPHLTNQGWWDRYRDVKKASHHPNSAGSTNSQSGGQGNNAGMSRQPDHAGQAHPAGSQADGTANRSDEIHSSVTGPDGSTELRDMSGAVVDRNGGPASGFPSRAVG
ncbi:hypothetical protein OHC33_010269 [Knufia fluminis]|uniref:Uncharacterized protein n=1 Tax=Knufia fluminis TaxID=191047 RepID=A0AAN8I3R5_9EURO|nr:hypothetical protein OHC33_010269 [Knufia fluminis]